MRHHLIAAFLAICISATAETMSIDQLFAFVQSSAQLIREGKMTDRQLADFLTKVTLKHRLDDAAFDQLQDLGPGPRSMEALRKLRDQSRKLPAGKPVELPSKPAQAPPPSSMEQAAIIGAVRQNALSYSEKLPDFLCTQVTRRSAAPPGSGSDAAWHSLDSLTYRLSYFDQKEDYRLVMVNDSPAGENPGSVGGARTVGDFGTLLREVFEPGTQARFEWERWATLSDRMGSPRRPTMVFAYRVDRAHSQWHISYEDRLDIVPGYHGLIYVDNETRQVARITLTADDLADFPVNSAELTLDYDYQEISGTRFLLPYKARTLMVTDEYRTRNDTEFRVYRKYSTESEITFEKEALPGWEEKAGEPPAPKKP
jgi:hypothetical protein